MYKFSPLSKAKRHPEGNVMCILPRKSRIGLANEKL